VEGRKAAMIVSELNGKSYKGLRIAAEENYEFTGAQQEAERSWEPRQRRKARRY